MLTLDQVRLLENRVEKAVGKIVSLTDENTHLRNQLTSLHSRVAELEGLVKTFRDDQGRIEEGILSALDRLSAFEDTLFAEDSSEQESSSPARESSLAGSFDSPENPVAPTDPDSADRVSGQSDLLEETEWEAPAELDPPPSAPESSSADGQMDIF